MSEDQRPADLRLGLWWVLAAGLAASIGFAATTHPLRATYAFSGTCLLAAVLRATASSDESAGGLHVRRKAVDVATLVILGLAVGIVGRSMNLHPHV